MLVHSFITTLFAAILSVSATGLDDGTVSKVRSKMLAIIGHSWEYGTATEALLELEETDVSVYGQKPFPPCRTVSADSPVITLAEYVLSIKPPNTLPLMEDGAAGDPASMGVAVLLANQTLSNPAYAEAAAQELDFLLNHVPRAPNGAISHRVSEAQLWDDFIYMGPPFLAYYGGLYANQSLLLEAKRQIGLYRDILRDPVTNLWHHILLGSWSEDSLWGTGMAWVAGGGTRVLQTMAKSNCARSMVGDMWELAGWIDELLSAVWTYQNPDGSLNNHPSNSTDFSDSSSTAMLAAATYRYAVLTGNEANIWNAQKAFDYIATKIADDGTLQGVVDVFQWSLPGANSPEGQAFVLFLQSAWRDYTAWKQSNGAPTLQTIWW